MDKQPIDAVLEQSPIRNALQGLTATNQDLCLLNYGDIVVLRNFRNFNKVRVVSGGATDDNLDMALLVGKGLLTSAILGYKSCPSSHLISRGLQELALGEYNCGVVVLMGANADKFNFGLAVDRALADCGTRLRFLCLDDCRGTLKPRFSAGLVLLIKIMGAMSELGATIDEMHKCFRKVAPLVRSVRLHVFSRKEHDRERVGDRLELDTDWDLAIGDFFDKDSKEKMHERMVHPVVVLVNASRYSSRMDELEVAKDVVESFKALGVCIVRFYLGNFINVPPEMASMTVLKVTETQILDYLDHQCTSYNWHSLPQFMPRITTDNITESLLTKVGSVAVVPKGPNLDTNQAAVFTIALRFACDALISCERQLNLMDEVGASGGVGTRLRKVCREINQRMAAASFVRDNPYYVLKKLSFLLESYLGGTMGTIYGIMLDSAAEYFEKLPDNEAMVAETWANALKETTKSLKRYCSESELLRSIYLPLAVCKKIVRDEIDGGKNVVEAFSSGLMAAEQAIMDTRNEHNVPHVGAHATGIWMRAIYEAIRVSTLTSSTKIKLDHP